MSANEGKGLQPKLGPIWDRQTLQAAGKALLLFSTPHSYYFSTVCDFFLLFWNWLEMCSPDFSWSRSRLVLGKDFGNAILTGWGCRPNLLYYRCPLQKMKVLGSGLTKAMHVAVVRIPVVGHLTWQSSWSQGLALWLVGVMQGQLETRSKPLIWIRNFSFMQVMSVAGCPFLADLCCSLCRACSVVEMQLCVVDWSWLPSSEARGRLWKVRQACGVGLREGRC